MLEQDVVLTQELVVQDIGQAIARATHQITPQSRRIYEHDAQVFASWLNTHGGVIDQDTLENYRNHLSIRANYAPATGKRMWSVARRIVTMQIRLGQADAGVLEDIKGIKAEDESPHIALTVEQARKLLAAVPQDTRKGKRDRAILLLLLHTGIRRSECAAIKVGDLVSEQGHTVLWILGKGNRLEKVKVPVQVVRAI